MAKSRILVVEDNRIIAEDIKNNLEEMGYEVCAVATNGESALRLAQEQSPDIAIMDIRLGKGMNGIEAAGHLQQLYNIPIIYLTAHADEDTLSKAKLTEPYAYLIKPFNVDELQSAVEIAVYKHRAQTKIRENQQWLETTLNSIGDGVIATDDKGFVKFMNPVAEKLTGWDQKAATGKPLDKVFHIINEKTRRTVDNPVAQVLKTGKIVGLANHTVLINRNGREIPLKDSGAPIFFNEKQFKGVVLVFQDDTKSRLTEKMLRWSKERLQLAMESAVEGSWEIDPASGKLEFDALCFKILGFDGCGGDDLKSWWLQRIHPDDREQVQSGLAAILDGSQKQFIIDYRIANKEGWYLWINSRAKTLTKTERSVKKQIVLGILRDITDRKNSDEEKERLHSRLRQAQKVEALGTLAGGIAHDFNNILASVIGFAELSLDETETGSVLHENLTDILASGMRARDLVRQILMFSRHVECEFQPTRLNVLVKDSLKLMRATIPTYVTIKEEIQDIPLTVMGNSSQINQIIVNLCTNGLHALEQKPGVLKICLDSVHLTEVTQLQFMEIPSGKYARLIVQDNGKGIDPDYMEKVFDPYFTTKDQDKGTGLGLAIVQGIVKSHNGHILVDSILGHGTTISIYFPLVKNTNLNENKARRIDLPKGKERILLVDDETAIVKMQKQNLERMGYIVRDTTSANAALKAFRAEPKNYDLVITDMAMPEISGDILTRKLKEIRPNIKVILCTGFSEKISRDQMSQLQLDGYLIKPVEKSKMLLTIRQVLDSA